MDRITFARKNLNGHRPRVDRFVAPRDSFPELKRRFMWAAAAQPTKEDIWHGKFLKQKKYMSYIDDAFSLESLGSQERSHPQLWPCIPRKKSHLSSADSILDLPTYRYATFPDLLDWSDDDILVAALGRNYHKWSWQSQSLISQGVTRYNIQSCKFDPKGNYLLLGTEVESVELHDNKLSKCVARSECLCHSNDGELCSVTAVDWSPTGNSFVIGCNRGTLSSYTRDVHIIRRRYALDDAVLVVRVSPDARYVAAAPVNGNAVCIMTWPTLQMYSTLDSDWIVRTITWHPWRTALLAIGSITKDDRACLATWDAHTGKVQESVLSNTPYCLDSMLFSKNTGELVLSLWNYEQSEILPNAGFQLVVLSDPETMVDQWGEGRAGIDRVRTMVFSPDGSKLATATRDEDLIIWNFLPSDGTKKKVTCRKFSSIPVYLDQTSKGYSLR